MNNVKRMALVAMLGLASVSMNVTAAEEKQVDETKLLRGNLWQQMEFDEKIAYIWGLFTVVEIERQLMHEFPSLQVENFSKKAAEAEQGKTLLQLSEIVDKFYQDNPEQQDVSVVRILWDVTVRPHISTGIAGRPLQR